MLGFILSKMHMLIFAIGILIVAAMFYNFIVNMELNTAVSNAVTMSSKVIEEQASGDSLCSSKISVIPDRITYGVGDMPLFYEMTFSKQVIGDANTLILSINERGRKSILGARKVPMRAGIVLIDPGFIAMGLPVDNYYDKDSIVLNPRKATKGELSYPPNAFIAVKEVVGGAETLYVIPCSTYKDVAGAMSNCILNQLAVGCYKLKNTSGLTSDSVVSSCFDVTRQVTTSGDSVRNYTWKECQDQFYSSSS
ncbi:MAG: hypothetical protein AABW59_03920 [archaeon]